MAKSARFGFVTGVQSKPKTTRQGKSNSTNYSATSRNGKRKAYRGQGH